jgi:hypothetical protein
MAGAASMAGRSLTGMANPTFKDGRHSKYLPSHMLDAYQVARADPNLLSLRDDIAVLDVRIGEVIAKISTGESGAVWRSIKKAWRDFTAAQAVGDIAGMADGTARLGRFITAGLGEYAAWEEVRSLLQDRAKLADGERKRLVDLQQNVPAERVMVLVSALLGSVREHVHEPHVLEAISRDFVRLVGGQNSHRLTSASHPEGNGGEGHPRLEATPTPTPDRP